MKIRGDNAFSLSVVRALGLEPANVRRIVLDMGVDRTMMAYIEMYGSDKFIEINVPDFIEANITILDKAETHEQN